MRTIETTARVDDDHTLTLQAPADIAPGEHRVVVVFDEPPGPSRPVWDFPVLDIGPWPEGLTLRREDMYGDDRR